jgi:tetratricopeptide (TPR) repeat protein
MSFLNLSKSDQSPMYARRPEYDADDMVHGRTSRHNVQRLMPPSFRKTITNDCGLPQYDVASPDDLPEELKTDRWRLMCSWIRNISQLSPDGKLTLSRALLGLGFHRFLRDLFPPPSSDVVACDENAANLALVRAHAGAALALDSGGELDLREYALIAEHAAHGSLPQLWAVVNLVVDTAKELKRMDLTERWCAAVDKTLTAWRPFDDFERDVVLSRVHRATAFRPFLQGKRTETSGEMELAERYALGAIDVARTPKEQLVARENLMTTLESRGKEALAFGHLDLAEDRTRRMLELDQLDPKNFLELGDLLVRRGKIEEALDAYRWAARLGPPATATAWYMAGQCLERLGEEAEAADCYLQTLACDPLGISAAERLHGVAQTLGWSVVAAWAQRRVEQLL